MLDLLLGSPPRRRASDEFSNDGTWTSLQMSQSYGPGRRKTQAGTVVDQALAMTYSACWCATRILCEPMATLPLCLMRRQPDGGSEHATDNHKYDVIRRRPNWEMGAMAFREGRSVHQVNWGNGFGEIEWEREGDPRSNLVGIWPIHPSRVRPRLPQDVDEHGRPTEQYRYIVRNNDGREIGLTAEQMLHIPGALTEDGIWGKSIVAHARETIGMGLGMERHGATQFGAGNLPRAAIKMPPNQIKSSEARREWRHEFKELHGSPDSGDVGIFPLDTEIQLLSFSNEAAQYLGSRSFTIAEVARWYGVQPHMLKEAMGRAGYNGLEHLTLEFLMFDLMPWLVRWEEQCDLKLLTPEERASGLYFQFELAGLLRGDRKTRYESYEVGLRSGWLTINMVNRLEGQPTIGPAGDQHFINMAYTTAERIYAGLPPPSRMGTEGGAVNVNVGSAGKGKPQPEAETKTAQPEALLDLADVRQTGDFDCGAAATQTVAIYFGKDNGREEADYIRELGTTETDGTEPENIIDWLNDNGLVTTSGQGMTLDDLRRFFAEGKPVIVPLQMYGDTPEYDEEEAKNLTGHYVVVQGLSLGLVFFQDPIGGRQMMAEADFDERWHDVEKEGVVDDHFGIAVSEGFGAEEEDEAGQEDGDTEALAGGELADSSGSADATQALEAARGVLVDALSRAFTREAHQALRAEKNLIDWIEERKTSHLDFLRLCLRPAFEMLSTLGLTLDLADVAGRIIEASSQGLTEAASLPPKKFQERMRTWSEQATGVAEQIMAAGRKR